MPSGAYAPVRNPRANDDADDELNAAFGDSDDEHDESHPLNPSGRHALSHGAAANSDDDDSDDDDERRPLASSAAPSVSRPAPLPGTYDFEREDYDLPPPGSPPPATRAFANDWGNSNGLIPEPASSSSSSSSRQAPRSGWFARSAAAVLPQRVGQRFGLIRPAGPVGGGSQNDGVFANVTAKPARGVRVQDGDETYIVPETAEAERPPSYHAAQADAVPTYWEATTVHVPAGGSSIPGEVIVEGLATGTLFAFLWNALVSVSFQFVGFLLTYLLHTTHAARFGSRAGLGVTLIQYGFAMRRLNAEYDGGVGEDSIFEPRPTFATAKEAEEWYATHNSTMSDADALADDQGLALMSDSASEWMAFFLMTIGWFVLLTSILGYWRVKRWESSILSTPDSSTPAPTPAPRNGGGQDGRAFRFERLFAFPGLAGARGGALLRHGLGFDRSRRHEEPDDLYFQVLDLELGARDHDEERPTRPGHTQFVIDETDPESADRAARALAAEQRLNQDLRAAGLL